MDTNGNNSSSSTSNPIDLEIMVLQFEYAAQLPTKQEELKLLLLSPSTQTAHKDASRLCHKIAGSGGTYGFKTITEACRYLEAILLQPSPHPSVVSTKFSERWLAYFGACAETFHKLAKVAAANQLSLQDWKQALTRADNALNRVWQSEEKALNQLNHHFLTDTDVTNTETDKDSAA